MKTDIHPKYYPEAKVKCACGHTFVTGSTMPEISIEICSNCHPFYTGKDKLVDTAGRVDRFKKIVGKQAVEAKTRLGKKVKKEKSAVKKASKRAKAEKEEKTPGKR